MSSIIMLSMGEKREKNFSPYLPSVKISSTLITILKFSITEFSYKSVSLPSNKATCFKFNNFCMKCAAWPKSSKVQEMFSGNF